MTLLAPHTALYTDYYQLSMSQGFFLSGHAKVKATFDYFFRENPFKGGFVVFAGLGDLLEILEDYSFENDDIEYLRKVGFDNRFLEYLLTFRFRGTLRSVREGEVVFPLEPLVRVEGDIAEVQVIETVLLNMLNFESLIATKAARLRMVAPDKRLVDFGLRRAQGFGGIHASKAAIIGGLDATSNVYSAFQFGLQATGTQGHSWIQSFDDELEAFRKFAEFYPDKCVLLVDTYNTLRSGIPNAIIVAKELEARGHRLLGIRLDSGDLAYLSKHAREMLDQAGLKYVKIAVSNQLDEYIIRSLLQQGAPIDIFGVGTRLVTGQDSPALDGVYKLSMYDGKPRLKFSENYEKTTLPGTKKTIRFLNDDGTFYADGVTLETESSIEYILHPFQPGQRSTVKNLHGEELLSVVMKDGRRLSDGFSPENSARYARDRLAKLAPEHKRFEFPHTYKVGISTELMHLRSRLMEDLQHGQRKQ
ncbi:MAG: nicotinate phosphoribosyltransferase [Ignavibacteriales bacterium]|nr:nicotinate phosphoribosyltransferase [Ignavibacteriales bacterium]